MVVINQKRHGLIKFCKVAECLLLAIHSFLHDKRPPPLSSQLVYSTESVW